ncbi:lmo0937 family membrane protein [Saliterribacillus persicus]|uniref:Lmo0937 family membrane protein n=1 Tax=Saliterribacillus persicus TaxID=930114 RepID=A0A368Y698_9BACI|nr:lmo0937 family membrane protein [Saliterribacillus persicus]RCW74868.1 hypothetical protein DFR57_103165 [Saliterribacillus persicus]
MIWTIIGVLLLAWLIGFLFDVGGIIHILLIIALVVLIVKLIRRA